MASEKWKMSVRKIIHPEKTIATTDDFVSKLDLSLTHYGHEMDKPIEALTALRPFLRYYQFFGFLPISISAGDTGVTTGWPRLVWIFTSISLSIQGLMTMNSIKQLIELMTHTDTETKVSSEVEAANSVMYFSHTLSMSLIMLNRLKYLPGFIESCQRVENLCKKYKPTKDNLVKKCWIVFGYFAASQLIGNALYFYSTVAKYNLTSVSDLSDQHDEGVESTGALGVILYIFEFYCDCGWIFGDCLLALIAIILTRFFARLNYGISSASARSLTEVEQLRKDHRSIKDLVEQCNQVFSPIILVNFMGNVAYLLTRLYTGLSDDLQNPSIVVRLESIYAFVYQINKIMIPTWLAALLNETAVEAVDTVHDWPSLLHSSESGSRIMVIGRFISQLINDPVGLSGCGYFTITKSFMVTLISGIMTYEVIILQFQQSGL